MAAFADESFLERNSRAPTRRFSRLGDLFAGPSAAEAAARGQMDGQRIAIQGAQLDDIMAAARRSQTEEVNRQAMAHDMESKGDYRGAAALRASHGNISELGNFLLSNQKLGWGDTAFGMANTANPDLNAINALNLVRDGKPVDLTKVEGDAVFNPKLTPGSQQIQMTALGQALIGAHNAQAGASSAAAQHSLASAGAENALRDVRLGKVNDVGVDDDGNPVINLKAQPLTAELIKGAFPRDLLDSSGNPTGKVGVDSDALRMALIHQNQMIDAGNKKGVNLPYVIGDLAKTYNSSQGTNVGPPAPPPPSHWYDSPEALDAAVGLSGDAAPAPTAFGTAFGGSSAAASPAAAPMTALGAAVASGLPNNAPSQRKVLKLGTAPDGTRVAQYDDGSIGPPPNYIQGKVYTDAQGNKAAYDNGAWVPQ